MIIRNETLDYLFVGFLSKVGVKLAPKGQPLDSVNVNQNLIEDPEVVDMLDAGTISITSYDATEYRYLVKKEGLPAGSLSYDNTTSGLAATTVQAAIDEVDNNLDNLAAADVSYDNTASGLTATDVQAAIDEVDNNLDNLAAADVSYDNTASGLTATDVQGAIDEMDSSIGTLSIKSWQDEVHNKLNILESGGYDVQLTTTGATDLQTAITALTDGQVLEVKTNGTYDPITLPAGKSFSVKVAPGYAPKIAGDRCIKIANGAANIVFGGFIMNSPTVTNVNYEGAAVTFAAHQTIVNNIIFYDLSVYDISAGSAVMCSYHWSVGGDSYDVANIPAECSDKIAFVRCRFYKGCKDGTEGACIVLRGCNHVYLHQSCIDNAGLTSRGLMVQNSQNFLVDNSEILNTAGANGEAIKIDEIGTCSYFSTGIVQYCRIKTATEGIDIDDKCEALVICNRVSYITDEALSLDDSSKGIFIHNKSYNSGTGIRCELGSICELKNNCAFNNTTNYLMENGYVIDASNSTSSVDMLESAYNTPITVNTPASWVAPVPLNVCDAVNRIANALSTHLGVPIP